MRNIRMMQVLKNCKKATNYNESQKEKWIGVLQTPNGPYDINRKGDDYIIDDMKLNIAQAIQWVHDQVGMDLDQIRKWLVQDE